MLKRLALALLLLAGSSAPAFAQSPCQWMRWGYVPTAAQWNSCWMMKQDVAQNGLLTRVGDTNYAMQPADAAVGTNAAFSAPRTWTLPPANSVSAGVRVLVVDIFGGVTSADPLTVAPNVSASNTLNNGVTGVVLGAPYSWAQFISDGVADWTLMDFGFGPSIGGGGTFTAPYDIASFMPGVPTASQLALRFTATRPLTFAADFGSLFGGACKATAGVASTGTAVIDIDTAPAATPNTFTTIGTVTFTTSAVGVCATTSHTAKSMAQGDVLRIVEDPTGDATLADISVTLPGAR